MRQSKPGRAGPKVGLADLKRLRKQADEAAAAQTEAATRASAASRRAHKRKAPTRTVPTNAGRAASPSPPDNAQEPTTPALSDADRRLFRQAVRYVEKIKDPGRLLLPPVAPAAPAILKERRLRAAGLDKMPAKRKSSGGLRAPAEERTDAHPDPRSSTGRATRKGAGSRVSDGYTPAGQQHDDRHYLRSGHGSDVLRDLRRGKWPIGASLDLHGSNVDDARDRFDRFLGSCLTHDIRCVRVVHGKGIGSPDGEGILKTTVRRWLTQLEEVIAYTECAETDGGAGAVQVLLRQQAP